MIKIKRVKKKKKNLKNSMKFMINLIKDLIHFPQIFTPPIFQSEYHEKILKEKIKAVMHKILNKNINSNVRNAIAKSKNIEPFRKIVFNRLKFIIENIFSG